MWLSIFHTSCSAFHLTLDLMLTASPDRGAAVLRLRICSRENRARTRMLSIFVVYLWMYIISNGTGNPGRKKTLDMIRDCVAQVLFPPSCVFLLIFSFTCGCVITLKYPPWPNFRISSFRTPLLLFSNLHSVFVYASKYLGKGHPWSSDCVIGTKIDDFG